MKLSASQAAKETGKSIPTITRAIEKGLFTAEKIDNGKGGHGYQIDPAELFRVFPRKEKTPSITPNTLGTETPNETGVLEVELKFLREKLADRDSQLAELRTDRDAWKEQAERATRLLAPPVAQERPKRAWWRFGRAND